MVAPAMAVVTAGPLPVSMAYMENRVRRLAVVENRLRDSLADEDEGLPVGLFDVAFQDRPRLPTSFWEIASHECVAIQENLLGFLKQAQDWWICTNLEQFVIHEGQLDNMAELRQWPRQRLLDANIIAQSVEVFPWSSNPASTPFVMFGLVIPMEMFRRYPTTVHEAKRRGYRLSLTQPAAKRCKFESDSDSELDS